MARYECNRCHTELNTTNSEGHVCKDLKVRYERQRQAVHLLQDILAPFVPEDQIEDVSLQIIKRIGGRDLGLS